MPPGKLFQLSVHEERNFITYLFFFRAILCGLHTEMKEKQNYLVIRLLVGFVGFCGLCGNSDFFSTNWPISDTDWCDFKQLYRRVTETVV